MANDNTHKKFNIVLFPGWMSSLVFLALLYAKLFTERGATLSWWWVFVPYWGPLAIIFGFFALWILLMVVSFVVCFLITCVVDFIEWTIKKVKRLFRRREIDKC